MFEMSTNPGSLSANCRVFTFSNKRDALDFLEQHDTDPVPNAATTTQYGTNSDACNTVLLNVHAVAVNKNAQATVSNYVFEKGEQLADRVLRAGPITDEENDQLHGMNKMVVDGSMYDPATQTINAEGYVDLNQLPDENEGDTHEGDTAASTSWTTAGACVYGTEANNAQLQEINLTHAGPEFEEVEVPVDTALTWTTGQRVYGIAGTKWYLYDVSDSGTNVVSPPESHFEKIAEFYDCTLVLKNASGQEVFHSSHTSNELSVTVSISSPGENQILYSTEYRATSDAAAQRLFKPLVLDSYDGKSMYALSCVQASTDEELQKVCEKSWTGLPTNILKYKNTTEVMNAHIGYNWEMYTGYL